MVFTGFKAVIGRDLVSSQNYERGFLHIGHSSAQA